MGYEWNFAILTEPEVVTALVRGFGVTILLTTIAVIVGTPIGFFTGFASCLGGPRSPTRGRASRATRPIALANTSVRWSLYIYIDTLRAIPLLLLMLLSYYGLPVLAGSLGLSAPSAMTCAAVALSLNLSAFIADVVRGATAGVPSGEVLAARSLGMTNRSIWTRIVLPSVSRETFPSIWLLYITIFKMSTLASAITVYEVLHTAEAIIANRYRPLELYAAICVLFIVTVVPLSLLARWLESTGPFRRMDRTAAG